MYKCSYIFKTLDRFHLFIYAYTTFVPITGAKVFQSFCFSFYYDLFNFVWWRTHFYDNFGSEITLPKIQSTSKQYIIPPDSKCVHATLCSMSVYTVLSTYCSATTFFPFSPTTRGGRKIEYTKQQPKQPQDKYKF